MLSVGFVCLFLFGFVCKAQAYGEYIPRSVYLIDEDGYETEPIFVRNRREVEDVLSRIRRGGGAYSYSGSSSGSDYAGASDELAHIQAHVEDIIKQASNNHNQIVSRFADTADSHLTGSGSGEGGSAYSYSGSTGSGYGSGYSSGSSGNSRNSGSGGNSGNDGSTGYASKSGSSGYSGHSGNGGYSGQSGSKGYTGHSGSGGYSGQSGSTGYTGNGGSAGNTGRSGSGGYSGNDGSTGYTGHSGSGGYSSNGGSTGHSENGGSSSGPSIFSRSGIEKGTGIKVSSEAQGPKAAFSYSSSSSDGQGNVKYNVKSGQY
ncbi:keratin, type I cytoskeletal 9-like [Diorhabda carinulata]|uniref:keratin, type I cytoskeletal 9-like n=1 Tax=Diorhabda carinulata TaxID=1163345 RepID=UPI0025A11EE6|nr:keratin, type I cytoskeletal 9-like [Diorhabda carinulata]